MSSAGLSHRPYIFCPSIHPRLSSAIFISKLKTILAKIRRISAYARLASAPVSFIPPGLRFRNHWTYLRPMQFRGPVLNGCIASSLSRLNVGSSRKRSGWNSIGLVQCSGSWLIAHCHTAVTVPSGIKLPITIAPPFGASRGKPVPTGG